jgi:hypothetical protein
MSWLGRAWRWAWDLFGYDSLRQEHSISQFVITLLFFCGMCVVTLAMWAVGLAFAAYVVVAAVQFCAAHPTSGEALGLYALGGGGVTVGLLFGWLLLFEVGDRKLAKRDERVGLVLGGVGVAVLLIGVVLFLANVHIDDDKTRSRDPDAAFCQTHDCIGDFDNEPGSVVQCADGSYSHAGGIQGACSHHGGVG